MKKFKFVLVMLVFTMLFAGNVMAAESNNISNKTALYLVNKSNEAMADVTSMKMDGYLNLLFNMPMLEIEDVEASMDIEALIDMPEKIYMNIDVEMLEEALGMEMYMTDEGMFMKMPQVYGDEWIETADAGLMAEIMAMSTEDSNALAEEMFASMGVDYNALLDTMNKSYSYNKNITIGDESYYVVESSMDVKEILQQCRDAVYQSYVVMEEQLKEIDLGEFDEEFGGESFYEGYADEAIAMYDEVTASASGSLDSIMYINKNSFYLERQFMVVDMSINMPEYDVVIDFAIEMDMDYTDFNSDSLPFPTM